MKFLLQGTHVCATGVQLDAEGRGSSLGNGHLIMGLWRAVNAMLHLSSSLKDFQVTRTAVMNMDGSSLCLFMCNSNIIIYNINIISKSGSKQENKSPPFPF